MALYVVGIDCATQPEKVGLSLAKIDDGRCDILEACTGGRNNLPEHIVDIVANWHRQNPLSLLALDAPLGWPEALPATLLKHQAGECIKVSSNKLFLRATDHHVKSTLGKSPLKVGADRIALTAIAALDYLGELRAKIRHPIPLAWQMGAPAELSVIEVYPAATCQSLGLPPKVTRRSSESQVQSRQRLSQQVQQLLKVLPAHVALGPQVVHAASNSDHVYDAVLCAIAAHEFVAGRCTAPSNLPLAQKEGWIWA